MEVRLTHSQVNPEALQTMLKLEGFIKSSGLDEKLYEFIKIRASQINGCAYCIDMHTRDLRNMGETEQRINLLTAWREAPFYSDKEKAVLELTEIVTRISENGLPQAVYEKVREHFDEKEFVTLIMAINTINAWNRIAISTGMFPAAR
ncbi:carboxymuconolactone decarboxylase family protein [Paenibacillus frigoriresistens]|uniref:carboxymuconolactone decarboxylase family protein n=1 Tax=Paenibacillus alginolyticus TaxID=59839 RepID=UPI001564D39D|nr:carboxymuconolactone decarboxylase family protein [Paenibacillus frigoriresistens]NRF95611.1 carboxymuconolactone decarboxylase family protein [Paenibacillus frigoriresistens]